MTSAAVDPTPQHASPRLSIIVPVYNDQHSLERCLRALMVPRPAGAEVIVVDDASTDESSAVAARATARVVRLPSNAGPAAARNLGAAHATGDILFFVDSDVMLAPGMLDHVIRLFETRPDVAAVFGSYDANPAAPGIVSRYKNLLHHFVHQHGHVEASTFWAGCGAIRKTVFEAMGGFDERRYRRASIEDIELGYRLRHAGHRILLDKNLQGTHLKQWTLSSLLKTDVLGRAVPWARLTLESGQPVNDLNVRLDQRLSAALVWSALITLLLTPVRAEAAVPAGLALITVIIVNRRLYGFFADRGGLGFAGACVLLHWLYYLYGALTYLAMFSAWGIRSMDAILHGRERVSRS